VPETLQQRAQACIARETLPRVAGTRTWAGHGDGTRRCSVCEQPVAIGHLEMQLEWDVGSSRTGSAVLHLSCFGAWRSALHGDPSPTRLRDRPARH
jgi:hypothetical protein